MDFFAIYAPSAENQDPENLVFSSKEEALKALKSLGNKDSRFKSFKNRSDAIKFAKNGVHPNRNENSSILDTFSLLKSPPPNQPIPRSMEKSCFPAPKSQELVKFRKEIEQNNVQKVYEMLYSNPRYLVSSGDTPAILKEGPRYNALHVAAMNKHAKMAKLILQTVEQTQFIELLHGFKNDPNIEIMCQNLLESYLNTPDKSRNETPLHFAAKVGALEVIEVLISYPLCKMTPNFEGLYPIDLICSRSPDAPAEVKTAIHDLLRERVFVPVLRSSDGTILPVVGKPFSPGNMPKYNTDPLSPSLEIKAYAGPMSSEQAQTFQKRWKTPPRLIPSAASAHNLSFSPKSSSISSPLHSPRMSKSMSEMISSTPKLKKKLFTDGGGDMEDDFESVYISNIGENDRNGNIKFEVLNEQEEKEFKELYEDLLEDKMRMKNEEKVNKFKAYRNPEPCIVDTPLKNDSNSNHIRQNFNNSSHLRLNSNDSLFCHPGSTANSSIITFLDESGSVFDNVTDSLSFKEKNIRLTDPNKGLETIGRGLASEFNVGWKEYWDFLGQFIDIRTNEGLEIFEDYLKQKEKKKELNEIEDKAPKANDSFGLSAICAGLNSIDLNEKSTANKKNGLTSPTSRSNPLMEFLTNLRQTSNDFPLVNPYTCIEQSCRTFAKRLAGLLEGDSIQDQHSYEKTLLVEINKLNTSIDSYKRDARFNSVNFQKVHARYSFLLVWYLKVNNIDVKYLRNSVPLMSKVYALATQFTQQDTKDLIKSHAVCVSTFTSNYIERQEKIFNPENVNTETACFDAWNGPDIIECKCALEINFTSSKQRINHRRDIRKRLYSGGILTKVDFVTARTQCDSDEEDLEDSYFSCGSDESSDEEYFTPPQSPTRLERKGSSRTSDDDDDMNMFEESLEHFEEDGKGYSLFINGDEPTKVDSDVFLALGDDFVVDESKFPFVSNWYSTMKNFVFNSKSEALQKHFRLFTPKLKAKD